MIVVDASVVFDLIDRGANAAAIESRLFDRPEPICAPYLIDVEIASVLRRHLHAKKITFSRAKAALHDFLDLTLVRFPHSPLAPRAFALRDNISAYDAFYVALAENLDAPLLTCDQKLARAVQSIVSTEVF